MRRHLLTLLALTCLSGCQPAPPTTPAATATPQASPIPRPPAASPTPSPAPTPSSAAAVGNSAPTSSPSLSAGDQASPEPDPTLAAELSLAPAVAEVWSAGAKTQLRVSARNADKQALDPAKLALEWSSDQPQSFSVDQQGLVTALSSVGSAKITVRDKRSQLSASASVKMGTSSGGGGGGGGGEAAPPPVVVVAAPTLTGLSPSQGARNGGTVVTLTGTHLSGVTAVTFNGVNATAVTPISDTSLSAVAPAGSGTASIAVTSSGGTATLGGYTYLPTISSFTPDFGAGGVSVTLTGIGFTGATAVSFDGLAADSFIVNNDTTLTAVTPTGGSSGQISVTTPDGTATSASVFFSAQPPVVTGFTPSAVNIGDTLTINGSNLLGASVGFNGVNGTVTANTGTQVVVTVPGGALTGQPVTVTIPAGSTNSASNLIVNNRIRFVKANVVGGANNGTTWANAYSSLQSALTAATSNDQIWIAAGTYHPAAANGNRNATFQLKSHVNVYGGFAGSETQLGQRNAVTNPVILSGDLNENDGAFAPTDPNRGENSFHVVTGANNVTLDGVTISGGHIALADPVAIFGGAGMLNDAVAPTVSHVIFTHNDVFQQGGGMANQNMATPTLSNVVFFENAATNAGGGGVSNSTSSNATLTNVVFYKNAAVSGNGGGMTNTGSTPTLTNVIFVGNTATLGGGLHNSSSPAILRHVTFFNNTASNVGNGIYDVRSSPVLTNCLIWAGGVHQINETLFLNNSSIEGGIASVTGAGTVTDGGNNDANPPVFVNSADPDGADNLFFTADDGMQLAAGANPAVDTGLTLAGSALADILGTPRPAGAGFDRGAYERTP